MCVWLRLLADYSQSGVTLEELLRTKTTSTSAGILCLICGSLLKSRPGARQHVRDAHLDGGGRRYRCPVCRNNFLYKNKNSFGNHVSLRHKDLKGLDLETCAV